LSATIERERIPNKAAQQCQRDRSSHLPDTAPALRRKHGNRSHNLKRDKGFQVESEEIERLISYRFQIAARRIQGNKDGVGTDYAARSRLLEKSGVVEMLRREDLKPERLAFARLKSSRGGSASISKAPETPPFC